jgi:hypothetical protein
MGSLEKPINHATAQLVLFCVYMMFFLMNWWLVTKAWNGYLFTDKPLFEFVKPIVTAYLAPLGVILAGFFTVSKPGHWRSPLYVFTAATIVILCWNVLYTWPLWHLVHRSATDRAFDINDWKTLPEMISFLSTGALTYFFLKRDG